MEKVLIIIPARGGSKGLPGKNIKILNNKPLLSYTIEQSRLENFESRTVVSTDSKEIANIAETYGIEISGDTASSESALIHALNHYEAIGYTPDYICFLQCTSPVRSKFDLQKAIELLKDEKSDSLLSVSPNHRFIWKVGKTIVCRNEWHFYSNFAAIELDDFSGSCRNANAKNAGFGMA